MSNAQDQERQRHHVRLAVCKNGKRTPIRLPAACLRGFDTIQEAVAAYMALKDLEARNGAFLTTGDVFTGAGEHVLSVTYNGRTWKPETPSVVSVAEAVNA